MKKIVLTISILIMFVLPAWSDGADEGLPKETPEQIKTSIQNMVKAGIQNEQALRFTRMMMKSGYQKQNVVRAHQIMIDTMRKGLSPEPVMNKGFEGMAKNIPEDLVIQAMEELHVVIMTMVKPQKV